MHSLRVVTFDQLCLHSPVLLNVDKKNDIILLCECREELTYVKHHKKKIVFFLSAMRHFAEELTKQNYKIQYIKLDDPHNSGSLKQEIIKQLKKQTFSKIIIGEPAEWRMLEMYSKLQSELNVPLEIHTDQRFLSSIDDFKQWAKNKKSLRMEYFYREMRKKYSLLMSNNQPLGGKWNYDQENRKAAPNNLKFPRYLPVKLDKITLEVIDLVKQNFNDHFGDIEPFYFAVTRKDALAQLKHFIKYYLSKFGEYQDAMLDDEPFLFHSVLAVYLNTGLLLPLEVCQAAEKAYHEKIAPLNAVEGFIRQILGWREYIRGVYWLKMPSYKKMNFLGADRPLPNFYWDADTPMHCIASVVEQTKKWAYSHHIQRLMVTGNFALLAGLSPDEVCEWYLLVYADAFEWVELPNTLGMALYGDGGFLASKPYAASGKYIHKMSNFCQNCQFDPNLSVGKNACPFNALYWNFLWQQRKKLQANQRLTFAYATLKKMDSEKLKAILKQAEEFFRSLQ